MKAARERGRIQVQADARRHERDEVAEKPEVVAVHEAAERAVQPAGGRRRGDITRAERQRVPVVKDRFCETTFPRN